MARRQNWYSFADLPSEMGYFRMELVQITRSFFAYHFTDGLLNHSPLCKQIVNRLVFKIMHRALAEERQPGLYATHVGTQSQIAEQY